VLIVARNVPGPPHTPTWSDIAAVNMEKSWEVFRRVKREQLLVLLARCLRFVPASCLEQVFRDHAHPYEIGDVNHVKRPPLGEATREFVEAALADVVAAIAATLTVGIFAYRTLFSFGCRFTPESESETTARMLRDAITTCQAVTRVATCPTVGDLKRSKILEPGVTPTDAWGNSFQLQCSSVGVRVVSSGPDRKRGSEDDVVIPKAAR
jgi:hypothetical protein